MGEDKAQTGRGVSDFSPAFRIASTALSISFTNRAQMTTGVCGIKSNTSIMATDFGLFTNTLSTPPGLGVIAFILTDIVLAIVAVITIRKVFPRHPTSSATVDAGPTGSPQATH